MVSVTRKFLRSIMILVFISQVILGTELKIHAALVIKTEGTHVK